MFLIVMAMLLIQPFQGAILQEESLVVQEMITTIAETNLLQLAGKKQHLTALSKKIEHLHPLDFLKAILTSEPLTQHLKTIRKSPTKWKAFVSGMSRNLNKVVSQEAFLVELTTFAEALDLPKEPLVEAATSRRWETFIKLSCSL